ncbi:hypothetical protein [Novosphingobium fuchskuhlense]|uniref:hypothetical protein n=1 Tax=Novosphingobium fuchskuhlense TaxID=1117702 RepID=UPI0012E35FF6|nr:hypothetical protein [Novosphingobium fuchskuhlense]
MIEPVIAFSAQHRAANGAAVAEGIFVRAQIDIAGDRAFIGEGVVPAAERHIAPDAAKIEHGVSQIAGLDGELVGRDDEAFVGNPGKAVASGDAGFAGDRAEVAQREDGGRVRLGDDCRKADGP